MITKFLNKPLSDDLISRIAEQCTFSGMKKNAARFSEPLPSKDGEISMLRKGVVGDWRNYFTPELNERFENEVLEKLIESGLEFDFEPIKDNYRWKENASMYQNSENSVKQLGWKSLE